MESSEEDGDFIYNKKLLNNFNTIIEDNRFCRSSDKLYLIVTADDFGYDARRDEGIVECFTKGIVTRASLLVNGSSAKTTAVQLAKDNNIPLGIHLNLTEGEPIDDRNWTLKGKNSRFFRGKFGFRDALSRCEIEISHVKEEIIAQIRTFIQLVGCLPNHVDGHQHIHVLPGVREVIAEVMQIFSLCQIRIPLENCLVGWCDWNQEFYNKVFQDARSARDVYSKYKIRYPEKFIGICLMGKNMTVERVIQAIEKTRDGQSQHGPSFCELMVHPGYSCINGVGGCGDGPDDFACSPEREHEASVLRDSQFKQLFYQKGICLMT